MRPREARFYASMPAVRRNAWLHGKHHPPDPSGRNSTRARALRPRHCAAADRMTKMLVHSAGDVVCPKREVAPTPFCHLTAAAISRKKGYRKRGPFAYGAFPPSHRGPLLRICLKTPTTKPQSRGKLPDLTQRRRDTEVRRGNTTTKQGFSLRLCVKIANFQMDSQSRGKLPDLTQRRRDAEVCRGKTTTKQGFSLRFSLRLCVKIANFQMDSQSA